MRVSRGHLAIPIFLNVILLAGVPYFGTPTDPGAKAVLVVFGLSLPWIAHFAVGSLLRAREEEHARRRREEQDRDFV